MNNKNIPDNDCFAYEKLLLKLCGFSTNQNIFYKIYSITVLVILTTYILASIFEMFNTEKDIVELTNILFFEIAKLAGLISAYIIYWNRYELQKLFEAIDIVRKLSNSTNDDSNILFIQICEDSIQKQRAIGILVWGVVDFSQILASILLSINKEEWLLPFGNGANINNNINFAAQIIVFPTISILVCLELFTYVNMLTLITSHCKQLQKFLISILVNNDLNSIKKAAENKIANPKQQIYLQTEPIDWKTFQVKLRMIVPYHISIFDAANQIENTFTNFMLVTLGGITISFCFLIFHATAVNFYYPALLKDFALLAMGNFVIILLSYRGEQVIAESENISKVCYDLDFIGTDLRIQKALLLIMMRAQKPITPTIGRLKVLDFKTMLAIFKAMYTYYTVLASMTNE